MSILNRIFSGSALQEVAEQFGNDILASFGVDSTDLKNFYATVERIDRLSEALDQFNSKPN